MSKVVAFTNITIDGVMQSPGGPDEDPRGGFAHGGWGVPYAAMQYAGDSVAFGSSMLFGRRTYEQFYAVWPNRKDNPFTAMLNNAHKVVASRTLKGPLPWMNSTLLEGDAAPAVARLKELPDNDLLIMGSGDLIQSLMRSSLIDEFVLLIHPLVLGAGRRLFPEGGVNGALRLVSSKATPTGVVIATYVPAAS